MSSPKTPRANLGLQRRKYRRGPTEDPNRRKFVAQGVALLSAGLLITRWRQRESTTVTESGQTPVRPPSASHDDAQFMKKCIGCGLCGTVCENGCIRYYGLDESDHGAGTPYLDVRRRSCTLCMRCTEICPTGALSPIKDDLEVIADKVEMGVAVVERDLCLSYLGRVCGFCHDACPLPGKAIKLTPPALPVIMDGCVGCGRCVEYCPQTPTAISIIPAGSRE
jgi:ferredoxin-type protein NapF